MWNPSVTILCLVLQLCIATDLHCRVSMLGKRMIYNVSDNVEFGKNISYSFANDSNVLASNVNPNNNETGIESTQTTLITDKCYSNVVWFVSSKTKDGMAQDFSANCSTPCPDDAIPAPDSQPQDQGVAIPIASGVLAAVGVIAMLLLCYWFKDKIRSRCTKPEGEEFQKVSVEVV